MSDPTDDSILAARSPQLMNRDDTALLIIDVQEKLFPHIEGEMRILGNIGRLIDGANVLGVKIFATEQYPKGLGGTLEVLAEKLSSPIAEKTMFSCRECTELIESLNSAGIYKLLLVGIEAHVCVAQTAFDLLAAGFDIFVCVDAVGSRFEIDKTTALRRLEYSGVTPTTTEAALFEWCERSGSPEFKAISKLVTGAGPSTQTKTTKKTGGAG